MNTVLLQSSYRAKLKVLTDHDVVKQQLSQNFLYLNETKTDRIDFGDTSAAESVRKLQLNFPCAALILKQ